MNSESLRRCDVLTVIWESSKTMKIGPFAQRAHIFWRREETEKAGVTECARTPAAHYTYIHQNQLLYLLCVNCIFFHLVSDEDGGPSQQVIRVWAGICLLSGQQSWKTWREQALWAIRNCGNLNRNLLLERRSPVTHSQNTARRSHLNHHANLHTRTYRHLSENHNSNAFNVHS